MLPLTINLCFQVDPMVQDSWDSARKITCDWQSKLEKLVTFAPFSVADMLQVAEVKFAGSGDNVRTRMEIQFGRGPFSSPLEGLTKIGDELTVVIYAEDGGAGYDIMVKNCYAYDSRNFERANKIRLLNDHGCLFRPHQMEYFKRTFDTRNTGADIIAFARMNAFKFPDKMDVFLSCEMEMCKGGCDTHCEMDDYPIDIIENLVNSPQSRDLPETEPVPTTFKPQLRKVIKGVKRRRKPKDFSPNKISDDALNLLTPPGTLSPELLQLLQELGAKTESPSAFTALAQRTDEPIAEGNAPIPADIKPESGSNKMSFSNFFAGTHSTSNSVPATILNNAEKFQPSQLLSAAIEANPSPFPQITSLSKGSTGTNQFNTRVSTAPQGTNDNTQFPPRFTPPALSDKLSNVLEQQGLDGPFFSLPNPSEEVQPTNQIVNFPANQPSNPSQLNGNTVDYQLNSININTLQQQLQSEVLSCVGSNDPKCNPQSKVISKGGFKPLQQSTTPNLQSTTLVFTSPRSVELLQQKLADNPHIPKKVLLKIVDAPVSGGNNNRPPRNLNNRPRFGTRLAQNAQRFAHFFSSRKKRSPDDPIRADVFDKETVNMIKGFQVVSASDLAFETSSLSESRPNDNVDFEKEICFADTAFYSGLLVICSILLLSGLVSICSIKKIRKYQKERNKTFFFGNEVMDSYQ